MILSKKRESVVANVEQSVQNSAPGAHKTQVPNEHFTRIGSPSSPSQQSMFESHPGMLVVLVLVVEVVVVVDVLVVVVEVVVVGGGQQRSAQQPYVQYFESRIHLPPEQ